MSVVMLGVIVLSIVLDYRYAACNNAGYLYSECRFVSSIMLSVILLNSVLLSSIMLSVVTLSVIMLSFIILSVIMLNVVMLSVIYTERRYAECQGASNNLFYMRINTQS
jgi:hypothetical protein